MIVRNNAFQVAPVTSKARVNQAGVTIDDRNSSIEPK
jgi:hypothetical protein